MATVAFGLLFGDEGKGTVVEYLSSLEEDPQVVRYNGGHQAGHNIVRPDGTWHCFAQFGSGSFEGCSTHLSRFMHIEPDALIAESDVLYDKGVEALRRLTIDPDVTIVTPAHKMVNQMREVANGHAHSTCGCGVGDAAKDRREGLYITLDDIRTGEVEKKLPEIVSKKLDLAQHYWYESTRDEEMRILYDRFKWRVRVPNLLQLYYDFLKEVTLMPDAEAIRPDAIFEGSQGTLLDHEYGFAPYITKSRATHHNALALASDTRKVGILPAFSHRHGNGPLPTENSALLKMLADPHNPLNGWQGAFRVGWFDAVLARYAIAVNGGVDEIFLTKLDRLQDLGSLICNSYSYFGVEEDLKGLVDYERKPDGRLEIHNLRVGDPPTGRLLTSILERCKPAHWLTVDPWEGRDGAQTYIGALERLLGVPIRHLSFGPTVSDKIARN